VDEFALTQLRSFDGKDLISIDSADVRFPESTNPAVEADKNQPPRNFTRVLELFRGALDNRVADVRLSERLTDSTSCLVNSEGTMSSQLQKVLSTTMKGFEMSKRVFEVNPHSRLTERLCELAGNPENDEFIRDCGRQLYSDALLLDGLIPDAEEVTNRSLRFMEELSRTRSVIVT
jgi:molecular chaperone HtpG